jgi:hypothetical protein
MIPVGFRGTDLKDIFSSLELLLLTCLPVSKPLIYLTAVVIQVTGRPNKELAIEFSVPIFSEVSSSLLL